MPSIRQHITYANVVSSLCLVAVLGSGTAYAATHLGTNSVGTKQLKAGAVTTGKVHAGAITTSKVHAGAITASKLRTGAVTASKVAAGAISPGKLASSLSTVAGFYNSGLIQLENGQSKVIGTRGPFQFTATCTDAGSGSSTAAMTVKNGGSQPAVLETDIASNYATPQLAAGASADAFYPSTTSTPYYFGDYYNMFAASGGSTSITGFGAIGTKVLDHDCVFQVILIG